MTLPNCWPGKLKGGRKREKNAVYHWFRWPRKKEKDFKKKGGGAEEEAEVDLRVITMEKRKGREAGGLFVPIGRCRRERRENHGKGKRRASRALAVSWSPSAKRLVMRREKKTRKKEKRREKRRANSTGNESSPSRGPPEKRGRKSRKRREGKKSGKVS